MSNKNDKKASKKRSTKNETSAPSANVVDAAGLQALAERDAERDEFETMLACQHTETELQDDGSTKCSACGCVVAQPDADATDEDGPAARASTVDKSWRGLQVTRMIRGFQFAQLSARVFSANAKTLGYDAATVAKLTERLNACETEVEKILNDFYENMPKDFTGIVPTKSGAPKSGAALVAGTRVRLNEKAAKRFADMFSPEDLDSLTVVNVKGGMAFCETASKTRLMASASQLERVAAKQ